MTDPATRRIDFVVCGVQKAGTTTLDRLLRSHPGVAPARRKEIHYFDAEDLDWSNPDHDAYHRFFLDWDVAKVRGEITPIYLYMPGVLARIRDYNPAIRLVASFRNPIDRAFSAWRMERGRGAEPLSFSEAIRDPGRRRVREAPGGWHRVYSYVERGLYAAQVERLLELFPRRQFLPMDFDALATAQQAAFDELCAFLGLAHQPVPPGGIKALPVPDSAPSTKMSAEDRACLAELYAGDVARLRRLTGLAFAGWTDWPT